MTPRRSYLSRQGYVGYRTRVELVREGEGFDPIRVAHPREAYEFLRHVRRGDRESLYSILLDSMNQVVGCEEVSRGSLNTTRSPPREVYKGALLANALGIILAHNHPSGNLTPSVDDIEFTRNLARAGEIIGVSLYDHLIVTDKGYTSLKERGAF